ncbi:MAG: PRC-barrel domain-containing protein, partial [Candidatus Jordarchaeaceae archaeon]
VMFILASKLTDKKQLPPLINPENGKLINSPTEKGVNLLNKPAVTETNQKLGKIEDFLIDTETQSAVKFYIKGGLFSPSLILPYEKVVRIEKNKVVFSGNILAKIKEMRPVIT